MKQTLESIDIPIPVELYPSGTVGVALSGSRLYGTHNDDSDYDIVFIVRNKQKATQTIIGKQDVSVVSIHDFVTRVYRNAVPEVFLLCSQRIKIMDENYRPIIESLGYNRLLTYRNLVCYSAKHLTLMYGRNNTNRRRIHKTLRTLARNTILARKLLSRETFSPVLSAQEKKEFKELLRKVMEAFWSGAGIQTVSELLELHAA